MSSTIAPTGRPSKLQQEQKDAIFDIFMIGVEAEIKNKIETAFSAEKQDFEKMFRDLTDEIKRHKHVTITTPLGTKKIEGLTHANFAQLLRLIGLGFPVMMVGGAGTGKTFAAEQVADALDLDFSAISVGAQSSKADLLGYMGVNGNYIGTRFRDMYEHGGVFLMDEIDAGNSNVLIVLNAALSGSFCAFPDQMVKKHENFRFIATGNTYGTGASRQYVGRNQLDAATLDRFVMIEWQADPILELNMVSHFKHGKRWQNVVQGLREFVNEQGMRVVVSPRATLKGSAMLDDGFSFDDVVEMTIIPTAGKTDQDRLKAKAKELW